MEPLTSEQLSAYLLRVKLTDVSQPVTPSLQLLCSLHLAHVQQVPYENLSIHLDKVSYSNPVIGAFVYHAVCLPQWL